MVRICACMYVWCHATHVHAIRVCREGSRVQANCGLCVLSFEEAFNFREDARLSVGRNDIVQFWHALKMQVVGCCTHLRCADVRLAHLCELLRLSACV